MLSWGKNICFCHVFFSSEYRLVFDCTFSNTLLLRPRESPTSRYNQVYLISFIFANFVQRRFRWKSQLHKLIKFDFCLASKFYFFLLFLQLMMDMLKLLNYSILVVKKKENKSVTASSIWKTSTNFHK